MKPWMWWLLGALVGYVLWIPIVCAAALYVLYLLGQEMAGKQESPSAHTHADTHSHMSN